MLKKGILLLIVGILLASAAFVGCAEDDDEAGREFLNITTATTGGTYYPMGTGLATLWTDEMEGINVSAQSSAGSVENVDILRGGEAELAIMQGLIGAMALEGAGPFDEPYEDWYAITNLWPNVEHFVLEEGAVETGTAADIEGLRFSVGPSGSGTERSTITIMEGLGLCHEEDIDAEFLGYDEAATEIRDGGLDGASMVAGDPVPAVQDLMASPVDVEVLDFTDEQLEDINDVWPVWARYLVEEGVYSGYEQDIETIAQPNWLAVTDEVEDEVVYELTRLIFEETDYLMDVHAAAGYIDFDTAFDGVPVKIHPAAVEYYEEQGVEVPEELMP